MTTTINQKPKINQPTVMNHLAMYSLGLSLKSVWNQANHFQNAYYSQNHFHSVRHAVQTAIMGTISYQLSMRLCKAYLNLDRKTP